MLKIMTDAPRRAGRGRCRWALLAVATVSLAAQACALGAVQVKLRRVEAADFPEVRARVLALNEAQQSLTGLTQEQFAVEEDGRPVEGLTVTSLLPGQEQIAVALVLDRSYSMRGRPLAAATQAAVDFLSRLSEDDAVTVVTFSSRPDPAPTPTTDRASLQDLLLAARASGETALYDAVSAALTALAEYPADRKAVVALTDGYDNRSAASLEACGEAARQQATPIYVIGLGSAPHRAQLVRLAEESGGAEFSVDKPEDLTRIYRDIAGQIQNEYLLRYRSPQPDRAEEWRLLTVTVSDGGEQGEDRRQFPVPPRFPQPKPQGLSLPGAVWGAGVTLVALDFGLIAALWKRRARARR